MAEMLTLELVSPLGIHKSEEIADLVLPAETGEVDILPGHDAMILSLGTGIIEAKIQAKLQKYFVTRGYIQIESNLVRVFAEICETTDEIDVERALQAKERAERRLKENSDKMDQARADFALKKATYRLGMIQS